MGKFQRRLKKDGRVKIVTGQKKFKEINLIMRHDVVIYLQSWGTEASKTNSFTV
jgi:hypothetical protein